MKKIGAIICIFIAFLIIYFLQLNFFNWFTIAGIKPNLFVMLILIIGLFAGKKIGTIVGFIIGVYLDILTSKTIGFSGIVLMAIGFLGGQLDKTFSKDSKLTIILTVLASTMLYEVITYVYNVLKFSITFEFIAFFKILFVELIYNVLLTIILYPLIQKLGYKLENIFKESKILTRYF